MNAENTVCLMHHLDRGNLKLGKAPKSVQKWLSGQALPNDLEHVLTICWPQNNCDIGPVLIKCSTQLAKRDDIARFLSANLLPIGSGPSGDTFVIDFSQDTCPVGYVTLEEDDRVGDPRLFLRLAARSFESFLYRISEGRYFPCDYYSTGDFNEFLRQEAEHFDFPPFARKP